MSDLQEREIYFNIACGYESMVNPYQYKMNYLNCDDSFFSLNCSKHNKNLEPYFNALYSRIKSLQDVIVELYKREDVEKITYFHTDTGNEVSIEEYALVNWGLEDFADKFFNAMNNNYGFTPTIKAIFVK